MHHAIHVRGSVLNAEVLGDVFANKWRSPSWYVAPLPTAMPPVDSTGRQ